MASSSHLKVQKTAISLEQTYVTLSKLFCKSMSQTRGEEVLKYPNQIVSKLSYVWIAVRFRVRQREVLGVPGRVGRVPHRDQQGGPEEEDGGHEHLQTRRKRQPEEECGRTKEHTSDTSNIWKLCMSNNLKMSRIEDKSVTRMKFFQITYARSQEHLMTLTEDLCENFEDYVQVFKDDPKL